MALPEPFSKVKDLLAFTSFEHGGNDRRTSAEQGTFVFSQFQTALKQSRYEIYKATLRKQNDEFDEDRLEQLREAELWLATSRLMPKFGEKIAIAFAESNLSSVGSVTVGGISADIKSGKYGEPCDGNTVLTNLITQGRLAA